MRYYYGENGYLTDHFKISEFYSSTTAKKHNIKNMPSEDVPFIEKNLKRVATVLETIRGSINKPIKINSGYRCKALNRLLDGSPTSAHLLGLAADIVVDGFTPNILADIIIQLDIKDSLNIDQIIIYPSFVHVGLSLHPENARHQILRKYK